MKNKKMKLLALGILATVVMSSAPVFAESTVTSVSGVPTSNVSSATASYYYTTAMYYDEWANSYSKPATLSPSNSYSSTVVGLQQDLQIIGFNTLAADGYFGANTTNDVKAVQSATHNTKLTNITGYQPISADGIVGPNTWGKIFFMYANVKGN